MVLVLVGNKCDVSLDERQVSLAEGLTLADRLGVSFLETSALDATNVEQALKQEYLVRCKNRISLRRHFILFYFFL